MAYNEDKIKRANKINRVKRKHQFYTKMWKEILASCIFIALSTSENIFSITNGAIWVFLSYLLTIWLASNIYVSQAEYNDDQKRKRRHKRRCGQKNSNKMRLFSAEIGGWNLIAAGWIVIPLFVVGLFTISLVLQFQNYELYIREQRDLLLGLYVDICVVAFVNLYYVFLQECGNIPGIKNKISSLLKLFPYKPVTNVIIHIFSLLITASAFMFFFSKEFHGIFGLVPRRILGTIYILYLLGFFRKKSQENRR